jgi:hypothetical protein
MVCLLSTAQIAVVPDQPQQLLLEGLRGGTAQHHLDAVVGIPDAAGHIGVIGVDNELLPVFMHTNNRFSFSIVLSALAFRIAISLHRLLLSVRETFVSLTDRRKSRVFAELFLEKN